MSSEVRTRVLGESGAWVEADDPSERLPKARRFILTASVPPGSKRPGGIIAEGVCFGDGSVALRRHEQASTSVYNTIEDVIATNIDALTWVD